MTERERVCKGKVGAESRDKGNARRRTTIIRLLVVIICI